MKLLSFKVVFFLTFVICNSNTVLAVSSNEIQSTDNAKIALKRLSNALHKLNFNTSFVVVKNNQAEPYHWLHGVIDVVDNANDENQNTEQNTSKTSSVELEILALLNGPRRDILRVGNTVSYIEPEFAPYSIRSSQISGPIPNIFAKDISALEQNYHVVSVGKSRVLGRAAKLIRIVPQDSHRYGYWLWLDQKSGLMLKLAVVTRKGKLLEQIQFTHLDITQAPSDNLKKLYVTELPKVIDISAQPKKPELAWHVNWLPSGFKEVKSDRHRLNRSEQAVEFMLFTDGLVDISVYVNPSEDKQRAIEYANDGATIVLNQVINNIEVSVVGKIPAETAKAIVNSVRFNRKRAY